jgi:ketosteroid isomerase-like protein
MRHGYTLLFPLLVACGRPAPGDAARDATSMAPSQHNEQAAQHELSQVEDEWERALKSHDAAFFQRTMSDDFIGTTLDGTSDKSTLVKLNADTSVTVDSVGRSEEKIRVYGGGAVGVITGRFAERGHIGSRKLGVEFRYTEVWVKNDGRWQVVAGHYTPVGKSK